MKVKIFEDAIANNLEELINLWIKQNPCFIDVKFATQSQSRTSIVISLFYEETGIKDKGDYTK